MVSDEKTLAQNLADEMEISIDEAELYVRALNNKVVRKEELDSKARSEIQSLLARGMVIVASSGEDYVPVHPRLALSNLFRAYEERLIRQRKEKRLAVDKLTLQLIPIYDGESKDTNSTHNEGKRR